jgi:hypothetical protein
VPPIGAPATPNPQSHRGDDLHHRPIRFIDLTEQLAQAVAGDDRGLLLQTLLRELHTASWVRR